MKDDGKYCRPKPEDFSFSKHRVLCVKFEESRAAVILERPCSDEDVDLARKHLLNEYRDEEIMRVEYGSGLFLGIFADKGKRVFGKGYEPVEPWDLMRSTEVLSADSLASIKD